MLLFDNNISHRLVKRLEDIFPNSTQVMLLDMDAASDSTIWQYAKDNHLSIVTKDTDFIDLSLYFGSPPKVIRLTLGNCKVSDVEKYIREHVGDIMHFLDSDSSLLEV